MALAPSVSGGEDSMKWLALGVLVFLVTTAGCTPAESPSPTPTVTLLAINSFSAYPATVPPGGSSTLSWTVSGAESIEIDTGAGEVASKGTTVVSPAATTVYTLVATDAEGETITATAEVTVANALSLTTDLPVIESFIADPPRVSEGEASTLSWVVSNTWSVVITPVGGSFTPSGSTMVLPKITTTYTLTATNEIGLATTATVTVEVS